MRCKHTEDRVLLDNLRRGQQLGCPLCYLERNDLPIFADEVERDLYYRVLSLFMRCRNSKTNGYNLYKDVEIHKEWEADKMEFVRYLKALPNYSPDKSIDRIDGNKGYIPDNLRWATAKEQAYNRKTTVKVYFNGEEMCFGDFAKKYCKLSPGQALEWYRKGLTLEELARKIPSGTGPKRKGSV